MSQKNKVLGGYCGRAEDGGALPEDKIYQPKQRNATRPWGLHLPKED